jgi:hypothetical protein
MSAVRYPVVELRQYTLRPGQLLRRSGLEGAQRRGQRHDDRQRQRAPAAARDGAVGLPGPGGLDDHLRQIERSAGWRDRVLPALSALITGAPQQLRLAPTARSQLR